MKHLLPVVFFLFATFTIGCGEASKGQYTPGANSNRDSEHERTIDHYTDVLRIDPNNVDAYQSRAYLLSRKGEHDRAIADYTQAIRLDPNYPNSYLGRGNSWEHKKEHDKAIEDVNQAIRLEPNDSEAYYRRGLLWQRKGEYSKAISDYTTSIQVDPQFLESLNELAWIQATCPDADLRNGKQAVEYATKACEQTE